MDEIKKEEEKDVKGKLVLEDNIQRMWELLGGTDMLVTLFVDGKQKRISIVRAEALEEGGK